MVTKKTRLRTGMGGGHIPSSTTRQQQASAWNGLHKLELWTRPRGFDRCAGALHVPTSFFLPLRTRHSQTSQVQPRRETVDRVSAGSHQLIGQGCRFDAKNDENDPIHSVVSTIPSLVFLDISAHSIFFEVASVTHHPLGVSLEHSPSR